MERNETGVSDLQESLKPDQGSKHTPNDPAGFTHNIQQVNQPDYGQDDTDDSTIVSLAEALNRQSFDLERFLKDIVRL